MPRISDSKGRSDANSGYVRLLGDEDLGHLISRVQATVIRAGNELEKILEEKTSAQLKASLEIILSNQQNLFPTEIQVVFRSRMPGISGGRGVTGDVLVFDHRIRKAMVIEVKDGDTFDTKKASGELESMTRFASWISEQTGYQSTFYFCSFNQDDKEAIVSGAKGRFGIENAMTGRELCELLRIDYDDIRAERMSLQSENLQYFLSEMLRIPAIRDRIVQMLQ
jgi:hypothetical protein